jgi:hypothetical protein
MLANHLIQKHHPPTRQPPTKTTHCRADQLPHHPEGQLRHQHTHAAATNGLMQEAPLLASTCIKHAHRHPTHRPCHWQAPAWTSAPHTARIITPAMGVAANTARTITRHGLCCQHSTHHHPQHPRRSTRACLAISSSGRSRLGFDVWCSTRQQLAGAAAVAAAAASL